MKALNHTGFSSTIKHEKYAKCVIGKKQSENHKYHKALHAEMIKVIGGHANESTAEAGHKYCKFTPDPISVELSKLNREES